MTDTSLYGLLSIVLGGMFSIAVAWVSRPRERRRGEFATGEEDGLYDERLTTVEGIATVVVQQGRRIQQLENEQTATTAKVSALTRYMRQLKATIRALGGAVPEPAPEDRPFIDQ